MQDTTFCAPCALYRLSRGEHPGLVLAGLPRDGARLGHPVCPHHRRALNFSIVYGQRQEEPRVHYNGTPVLEMVGWEQRSIFDQIDLIALVRGDPDTGIDGLLNVLRRRLRLWQWQQWEHDHIDQQTTTILPPTQEMLVEEQATERMFERIAGYLALKAAGLDTGPVQIYDPDDRISGEE